MKTFNLLMKRNNSILITCIIICVFIIFVLKQQWSNTNQESNKKLSINFTELFELYSEIKNQTSANKEILMKTLLLMAEQVDEDDPKLIEYVKSLITLPSQKELNLENKNTKDYSQLGQSTYMDHLLKSKRNGFFIEAGAFTGEFISNSLFFEKERGWTGLLVEPIPENYQQILTKNRKVYTINCCLAKKKPMISKFRVSEAGSGRFDQMSQQHNNVLGPNYVFTYIPCFSLNTILMALNVNKIDYFSLDVEGGEYDVLESIDYKKIDITSFSIEHNQEWDRNDLMVNFLTKKGYTVAKTDNQDVYLIKK